MMRLRCGINKKATKHNQERQIYMIAGWVRNHYPLQVHGDCHAVAVDQQSGGQPLP